MMAINGVDPWFLTEAVVVNKMGYPREVASYPRLLDGRPIGRRSWKLEGSPVVLIRVRAS